jgi:glycerol-3-phosphate dehydrogenase (NAD(P)+)
MIERVGIVGGGAWGTALALVAARAGRSVTLWARDPGTVASIRTHRENRRHLPGLVFDASITATENLACTLDADAIILAVPAQTVRSVSSAAASHAAPGIPVVLSAKGLERGSAKRLSEVLAETIPAAIPAVLSGPSFAIDVARRLPTAVTIAAVDEEIALDLCHALGNATFRPYAATDIVGVEIGGAVKNVYAIAAGIVAGRGLGASALAALIARSFAELRRLAEALGAEPETLMGLSGLGDLVLTCSGPQSRNFAFGRLIGTGGDIAAPHPLAEGIETAFVARDMAAKLDIEMPIAAAVAGVLAGSLKVDDAIDGLMSRPLKHERR